MESVLWINVQSFIIHLKNILNALFLQGSIFNDWEFKDDKREFLLFKESNF